VDRNRSAAAPFRPTRVALLAEGVDRNRYMGDAKSHVMRSPSSQRAWIEIREVGKGSPRASSPSSQRAWIEI